MKIEQFWDNVAVGDSLACWEWQRSRTTAGYGHFRDNNIYYYAHRVAYEVTVGPIAPGLVIDHLCRNRACVNPSHLEAVTQQLNVRRGAAPYGGVRTVCRHGHDITKEANVYTEPNGNRRCRVCANAITAQKTAARRARGDLRKIRSVSCKAGHAFDELNTYIDSRGRRVCRTCARIRAREYRRAA